MPANGMETVTDHGHGSRIMNILVIGLNHKTADVEIREKFSFPEASLTEALLFLRNFSQIDECIILSTCNRVEIYAWVKDKTSGIEEIK